MKRHWIAIAKIQGDGRFQLSPNDVQLGDLQLFTVCHCTWRMYGTSPSHDGIVRPDLICCMLNLIARREVKNEVTTVGVDLTKYVIPRVAWTDKA